MCFLIKDMKEGRTSPPSTAEVISPYGSDTLVVLVQDGR